MNTQALFQKPQANITPKITKISSLVESSNDIRKSSTKLRKVFEKGTYQKRTQLNVLGRYKKRLESIQKQNDKSFKKRSQAKVKLPDIKKYTNNLFTADSTKDPLRSLATLAAFKSFQKGSKGDFGGALASGLMAAGLFFGPGLLGRGIGAAMNRGGGAPGAGVSGPSSVPSWWQKNPKSLSRANQSYARFVGGNANIGDRARLVRRGMISPTGMFSRGGPQQVAKYGSNLGRVGKAFGRFGKSAIPLLGAGFGAADAAIRANEGDVTGASIAGTSATLDAISAGLTATGVGVLPAAILSVASFGLDVINLVRDLSGASEKEAQRNKAQKQDRLPQQTEQQKRLVERKKESDGKLTFRKTLNSYEKVVNKFEEFSKSFVGGMGLMGEQTGSIETGNRGINTGENLEDLEAEGGETPGRPYSRYGPRWGRMHQGNDYAKPVGTPISIVQPGVVTVADMNYDPNGWGAVVEVRHQDGSISRYAHLSKINVAAGTQVSPGQVIGNVGGESGTPGAGNSQGPHLHFEYETAQGRRIDPTDIAPKIFRFGGNVRVKNKSQVPQNQSPQQQSSLNQSLSIGSGGFRFNGATNTQRQQRPAPQMQTQVQRSRQIESYPSYDSRSQVGQVIPLPIPQQVQQPSSSTQMSEPILLPGPSQQSLLNSFYKRVLLNTV